MSTKQGKPIEDLRFDFWPALDPPPGLKHREGKSKADLAFHFANTVVVCEVKFMAQLSESTTHARKRNQLLRYADVFTQHYGRGRLFDRRLFIMTLTLDVPDLVRRYQQKSHICRDLIQNGYSEDYSQATAEAVTFGASTWDSLAAVLASKLDAFSENDTELAFTCDVIGYIATKVQQARGLSEKGAAA
ncbi:MAG: hypothetical protein KGR26_06170 [Cyanobacteria bacterium REEB65]|nr:hypothetical protein [Cyanobacteria bacterium REEB65]